MIRNFILILLLITCLTGCGANVSHDTDVNKNTQKTNTEPSSSHDTTGLTGWTPTHVKVIKNNNANEFSDVVFINSTDGWKALYEGVGMGVQNVILYKTNNGGNVWKEIANSKNPQHSIPTETKSGIIFVNSKDGWITTISSKLGYIGLYKTKDGGINWSPQSLSIPANYSGCMFDTYPPIFFSSKDGILLTKQNDLEQLVFVTHDAGNEWIPISKETNDSKLKGYFIKAKGDSSDGTWEIAYQDKTWRSQNGFTWNEK